MREAYEGKTLDWRGAGASKNGGEAAIFCEYIEILDAQLTQTSFSPDFVKWSCSRLLRLF